MLKLQSFPWGVNFKLTLPGGGGVDCSKCENIFSQSIAFFKKVIKNTNFRLIKYEFHLHKMEVRLCL